MPITDNSFAPEELGAALTANPALLETVKTVLTGGHKLHVLDETQRTQLLTNHEATVIGNKTREIASNIEKDVKELTGMDKINPDEKYYEYLKRTVGETKKAGEKALQELTDLRAKGGDASKADLARIEQLEKTLQAKDQEWKGKYEQKDQELRDYRATASIESGIAKLRSTYKQGIPEIAIQAVEQQVIRDLLKTVKFQEDGSLTFLDDKGEVILNTTTYKPATAEDLLKGNKTLAELVDAGRQQQGSGTQKDQSQQQGSGKFTGLPANVKTKQDLTKHLLSLGIIDGSEEWDKIYKEHGEALPLR